MAWIWINGEFFNQCLLPGQHNCLLWSWQIYWHRQFLLVKNQFLKVFWRTWRHRMPLWQRGLGGTSHPAARSAAMWQRLESSDSIGSPRGLLGKQEMAEEKKQTANEKGTCCKPSIAKHGIVWRAVPPQPVQELGRAREGPAARTHSRDLPDVIKTQYLPDKACK